MSAYRSTRDRRKNYGAERAAQHIREAKEFSEEVGGTDKDVKSYFFSIDGRKKEEILTLYGQKFGEDKEEYAREAWQFWASGRRRMSGMVAKRLFALLPNHMPVAAKLKMVESLWRHCSPSSRASIRIDSRSENEDVMLKVREYFEDKLAHKIPDNFTRRFNWLAGADSRVKQQLLNHFRELELGVVGQGLEPKLEVLRKHLQDNSTIYISGDHIVSIGNHRLVLSFDNSVAIAERNRALKAQRKAERDMEIRKFFADFGPYILVAALIAIGLIMAWAIGG